MKKKPNVPHLLNIILTNFCNQNCSFCYAKNLMNDTSLNKKISIDDFKKIIKKIKTIDYKIKLLGGEPTLHPEIDRIVSLSIANFGFVQIFTNCLLPENIYKLIKNNANKINLTINISTPAFQNEPIKRALIIKRIKELSALSSVTLSIVIGPNTAINSITKIIDYELLNHVRFIRLGLLNTVVGQNNTYSFEDFPKIGTNIIEIIKQVLSLKSDIQIFFDCGFTRCMFNNEQFDYLIKNHIHYSYLGCYLGRFSGHFDIQTDLKAISCYSLSNEIVANLRYDNIKKAQEKIYLRQHLYQVKYMMEKCKKCKIKKTKFYECSGPCLGFRINSLS